MTSTFDPELIEFTYADHSAVVHVYKVGGGTVGTSYEGLWGYRIRSGRDVAAGEDLRTGTPKTHREVAQIALSIHRTTRGRH